MNWHPIRFLVPCLTVSLLGAAVVQFCFTSVVVVQHVSRNMVNLVDRDVPDDWAVDRKDLNGKVTQEALNIQWSQALGSRCYGGPVIAGGRIFIGTNNGAPRDPRIKGDKGVLMCFRQSDGAFLWQTVHDKLPNSEHDWPQHGIISHPAVEDDRLWYVSNRSELICANVADGSVVWRLDMMKLGVLPHHNWAGPSGSCPLVAGDLVFVVTGNGVDMSHVNIPAPEAPSFLAVDKHTGQVTWQDNAPTAAAVGASPSTLKRLMNTGQVLMHGQWSNPAYAVVRGRPQVIFPGGDGWLRAYEPRTGALIWKFDANPKHYPHWMSVGGGGPSRNSFLATPVVVGDRLYIGTGEDPEHYDGVAHFWCIDITRTGDISPELVDDTVFPPKTQANPNSGAVWVYGGLTTPLDRKVLGRDHYFGRTMSTAAVHDGLVYVAELAGLFYCLDAATGKPLWQHDLKASVHGSPYWVDGKVYVGTEDGEVWIFEHGPVCKLIRRIDMGNTINSTPVVVDRVLYIGTDSCLYAIAPK